MDGGEEKRRRRLLAPSSTAGKLQLISWAPDPRTRKERELGFEIASTVLGSVFIWGMS